MSVTDVALEHDTGILSIIGVEKDLGPKGVCGRREFESRPQLSVSGDSYLSLCQGFGVKAMVHTYLDLDLPIRRELGSLEGQAASLVLVGCPDDKHRERWWRIWVGRSPFSCHRVRLLATACMLFFGQLVVAILKAGEQYALIVGRWIRER